MTFHVVSSFSIALYFAFLSRIIFGPFSYNGVVAFHYGSRLLVVSFLTMLSFKTVVNTLFVVDFDWMSGLAERKVMIWMGAVTSVSTLMHVLDEAVTRKAKGLDHFARWCFNIYLGKVDYSEQNNFFNNSLMINE